MLANDLAIFYSDTLQILGTVRERAQTLRNDGLLTKGKQGPYAGAIMTNSDATSLMMANVLDHERGDNVADSVRRVRELPPDSDLIELPFGFARGLTCLEAKTAGAALDALLGDIRTGRLAKWAAAESYSLKVTFEARGASVFISVGKPHRYEGDFRNAIRGYNVPGFMNRTCLIERNVTVGADVFLQIAEGLERPPPS